MKQLTRESEAFKLASNWLSDEKGVKILAQRDGYEKHNGGSKDRFYQIRSKGSMPYERDIKAMNMVHPEFEAKYKFYLESGTNPADLERAGAELKILIEDFKKLAGEARDAKDGEIQALKDLIVHLKEKDALNKRLLAELDNLKK